MAAHNSRIYRNDRSLVNAATISAWDASLLSNPVRPFVRQEAGDKSLEPGLPIT